MKSSHRIDGGKRQYMKPLFLLIAVSTFWVWRIHYGGADIYACPDESFYISIPYRMLFGDMLLYDEMNTTQMVAFLLFPFVKAWNLIHRGNTEGIILSFRYIWLVCHMAVSVIIYLLGRKKGYKFSIYAALIYSLSVPVSLMALSYNTITYSSATLLVLLYYLKYDSMPANIVKGFLLAMMVLCNPYCLLIYLAIVLLTIVNHFVSIDNQLSTKHFLALHIGILLLLLPFLAYLAVCMRQRGLSIPDLVNNLMTMLSFDGAHDTGGTLFSFIKQKSWFAIDFVILFPLFPVAYIGILMVGLVRKNYRKRCIFSIIVLVALYSVYALFKMRSSYILCLGAFIGMAVLIYEFDTVKKHSVMACTVAILFVMAANFCSGTALHAVSWACTALNVLTYLMLEDSVFLEGMSTDKAKNAGNSTAWKRGIIRISFCFIAFCILSMDIKYVFWDEPISELTVQISEGPMKGICTTEEKSELYTDTYRELKAIPLREDDTVLIISTYALDLLTLQREVCSPSTWLAVKDLSDPLLEYYYQSRPDKIPSVVIFNKNTSVPEDTQLLTENGYIVERDNEVCTVFRRVQENTLWTK